MKCICYRSVHSTAMSPYQNLVFVALKLCDTSVFRRPQLSLGDFNAAMHEAFGVTRLPHQNTS